MKNRLFAVETMAMIGNDQNNLIFGRNQMRNIIQTLYEENKRISVMFWGCVTSKGVGAIVPTSETTDTRKYIEILEKYLRP